MATTKLTTIEDLWEITEPGRYDVIDGDLYQMPPAGGEHGEIEMTIGALLWQFVRHHRLGKVYSGDTGFILSRDPLVWLSPDAAFVRADRLPPPEERAGFLPLAPDLAVEIVSPSDRPALVSRKVQEYLRAGTRLVWVVEPRTRTITIHRLDQPASVYTATDEIDAGDILPGFRVAVTDLFQ